MALLCGRLLTVANLGDADAVVDTSTEVFLATVNHRIQSNHAERARLEEAGAYLAPASAVFPGPALPGEGSPGPLRCWPGGSLVSRAVGDVECGECILSWPHLCQMTLPKVGARVVLGSSGLWDLVHWKEAALEVRGTPLEGAASRLIHTAMQQAGSSIQDDASALVVDALPAGHLSMDQDTTRAGRWRKGLKEKKKIVFCGLHRMLCSGMSVARRTESESDDRVHVLARIDGWVFLKSVTEAAQRGRLSNFAELSRGILEGSAERWSGLEGPGWVQPVATPSEESASSDRRSSHAQASTRGTATSPENGHGRTWQNGPGMGSIAHRHSQPYPGGSGGNSMAQHASRNTEDGSKSFQEARFNSWMDAACQFTASGWRHVSRDDARPQGNFSPTRTPSTMAHSSSRVVDFVMSPAQAFSEAEDTAFQGSEDLGPERPSNCNPVANRPCGDCLPAQRGEPIQLRVPAQDLPPLTRSASQPSMPVCMTPTQRVAFTMTPSQKGLHSFEEAAGLGRRRPSSGRVVWDAFPRSDWTASRPPFHRSARSASSSYRPR
ncbi:unnamed protein product [Ostreobium quekettii]|uniref:PPM-type phosphatase domain-containing protein n=1 Tax=Ostreobium quekettii TaxID=121088 RepID=A0A8S1ITT0_9CHLO|nr:unnamed protein product [Ostreobium quekettii]